ncbi:type I restriction endonuclease subunit R [Egibacter rhizosphaerae]|uniref:Type I restriction endonuclease subunit R n=1 Tax=Egibacter rhizosphaerae TaxID=1670831 RepID=A0A411YIX8_9ACTN|nr:RNA-binding domain-containing protein [Egibacter rhizosphaerae]QBI21032.1 type I restriction endonuclease subunit R [Egibacter rhizosphaerae]
MSGVDESAFEGFICGRLGTHGGYGAVKDGQDFDAGLGLDFVDLFGFVEETQAERWVELVKRYGGEAGVARDRFSARLGAELDKRGVVDVLRGGLVDQGVTFRLAFFRPAHGLTSDLVARYEANRVTVTRQLGYEPGSSKSVDLGLLVNGIPVATAELKNPLTGQGVDEAIAQYRKRDAKNLTLARAVVHFAVDPQRVAMTTRLAGPRTRFLPFNRGHGRGAGNPANPEGHASSYLWERVWQRDAWLDLLSRFVHVEKPGKGSRRPASVIFPRFHQWEAVRVLEDAAAEEGAGHNYLVQHSAGSGKSNTIAWLAHRLSTLHAGDAKVFDKVVVITDRVVLDRQLQETIYQFEHAHGVVERIEQSSAQLAEALAGERARIVVTTLQKFPFVLTHVEGLPDRRYAVLVDEAHSSQTGEAAKELRRVLGAATPTASSTDGDGEDAELAPGDVEEALADAVAARGRQSNMSFFAFTATPKGKTLELFGRYDPSTGRHEPFHLYSMRQAIEEGFIHDVLANFTTYQTFWRLEKAIGEDPAYETAKARKAIARFVTLHEHNLSQKAAIVVDHFQEHVAHKVAGQAKAMVVCSSRAHAVRFFWALRAHVDEHGHDLGVLVAFSGAVTPNGGEPVTEAQCNGFGESETAARFDTDDYQIMVVAEKFQTGFDQPKLYAMYVDKPLTGLAAVQTLSRLNRTHPDKDGTFVLDFVNDADDIAEAFEPYYGETVAPPSDPNLLYDTRHQLDEFGVLRTDEATAVAGFLLAPEDNHDRVHAALTPAIDRFWDLEESEQERFRDALGRFVRTYAFLSQIVSFTDTTLERDYLYTKALGQFIKAAPGESVDLGDEVELTHLRHEQRFTGSVALDVDTGEVSTIYSGQGRTTEPDPEPLSEIIHRLNAQYGTDWSEQDRLVFDAALEDLVADADFQVTAVNNTPENFSVVFPDLYQNKLLGRLDRNEKVVFGYLDDPDLQAEIHKVYATLAQARAKVAYQEHCPIAELLGSDQESAHLEYKATLRTHADTGEVFKPLETATLKTIAAFANSRHGGTLLIGVADDGTVTGLDPDYASLAKPGKDPRDLFRLHLTNILVQAMGETVAAQTSTQIHTINGHDLARVHVHPATFPVDATVTIDKQGQHEKKTAFYIRIGNATREITAAEERQRYIATRWGNGSHDSDGDS